MKRFLIAIALACVLPASALAGEVPTGGLVSPPPPGTAQTSSATTPGNIPTGGFVQQLSDEATMDALLAILGLLA